MQRHTSSPVAPALNPLKVSTQLRLKLMEVAEGDLTTAQMLQSMLWQAYSEADCPFGPEEDGMFLWWAYEQQGMRQ